MIGLVIIFISILTGIFAYFIANDSTPNADRQIVEIQAKKPGYKRLFIKIKKEKAITNTNFFIRLLYGKEDAFNLVPINTYEQKGDLII